jgi:protease-4
VFAVFPSFENLLAEYGVASDGVRTTGLSGQPDLLAGLTPEVDMVLQGSVENTYARFLTLVSEARGISVERADELGQGRVWDGGAARQLGLVDQFGDLDAAIAWAAERAELGEGDYEVRFLGDDADPYASLLAQLMASDSGTQARGNDLAATFARREIGRLARVLDDLDGLMATEGVQARCMECTILPAPGATASVPLRRDGWVGMLARLVEG